MLPEVPGIAWALWGVFVVGGFAILEAVAVRNGPSEDALSHVLRRLFRVREKLGAATFLVVLALLNLVLLWLSTHIIGNVGTKL